MKNISMAKAILLLFLGILLTAERCAAQTKIFRMRAGDLAATVYHEDGSIDFGSNTVYSLINNETGEISIKIPMEDLRINIDSLDQKMRDSDFQDPFFEGNLNVDYINLEGHSDQQLDIDGNLTIGEITKYVRMQGTIKYWISGPDIQCMLYIRFDLELTDFGLENLIPGAADKVCVEILQPIIDDIDSSQ